LDVELVNKESEFDSILSSSLFSALVIEMEEVQEFLYQKCFCEENVWHLVQHERLRNKRVNVAIVSNAAKKVAVWHQKASKRSDQLVVWDYHVIAFASPCTKDPAETSDVGADRSGSEGSERPFHEMDPSWEVWDLDSTLGFPVPIVQYIRSSFVYTDPGSQFNVPEVYKATLRLMTRERFVRLFSSDRSHMMRPDGSWKADPPSWAPIFSPERGNILFSRFVDMPEPRLHPLVQKTAPSSSLLVGSVDPFHHDELVRVDRLFL